MRCLSYLLLLRETLKKTKKLPARLVTCYEILTFSLTSTERKLQRKGNTTKMAAELLSATSPKNTKMVVDAEKTKEAVCLANIGGGGKSNIGGFGCTATIQTSQQNISTNNADAPSWQSHPTLRER